MKSCSPTGLPQLTQLQLPADGITNRSASLQSLLRRIAEENRNGKLQAFYSIRTVAKHFDVPPARVSRIYRGLSSERVLRMIWGSKTLLEPQALAGNGHCKSIGIPVGLGLFMESVEYRETILLLQSEIWNHEIEERLLFFRNNQYEIVALCTQNHHPRIDTIVWLFPDGSSKSAMLRLRDLGFRVFCLSNQLITGMPDCHLVSGRSSIRTILRKEVLRI